MNFKINDKVKHLPTGDIIKIDKITKVFIHGYTSNTDSWWDSDRVKVRVADCETYVEPIKEKSFYDKMRERNMEDAKKLPKSPENIAQHILWLKMAVIDRVEKIENLVDDKIYTFTRKANGDDDGKFGFSEHYVNLLMHYAYEAGKQNATDNLTKSYENSAKSMKNALDKIKDALDDAGWIEYSENNW